ncbi:hypothetical protein SORBI_3004G089600 [Sorghum bicolor]|uniref:Uncharacterized protein n=1 Tax=Sorghum bicolor TaxID=4558 RepID=A0A194YNH2_SORBI|nr:hypothetical protein SORBI_3004G089600 [Sorghum bicolor]
MDKIISHVLAGVMLSGLGLWHLFNHIRLFDRLPCPDITTVFIMLAYSPMPFDAADGSIPPERMPNHEHAIIYASLLIYAGSAMYLDRHHARHRHRHIDALHAPPGGGLRAGAVRVPRPLHRPRRPASRAGSTGSCRPLPPSASPPRALLGAGRLPAELQLAVSLVRSASLAFQGLWGVVIAWIPAGMAPKGCSLDDDGGGVNLRCHGDDSLHHAVAVVNLQFGWCMVLMTVFVLAFYVHACKKYPAGEATTTIATYLYGRLPEAQWRSQNLNISWVFLEIPGIASVSAYAEAEAADGDDDHHN